MAEFRKSDRWGDDDGGLGSQPKENESNTNDVHTIVDWKLNGIGQQVKVTKEIKTVTEVYKVSKRVLERKTWAKFGAALNIADSSNVTYISHEEVRLEDSNTVQLHLGDKTHDILVYHSIAAHIVVCRHCGMTGDHWTLKCPYKDTPIGEMPTGVRNRAGRGDTSLTTPDMGVTGKYVPPNLRSHAGRNSDSHDDRDSATLRVTNISPDTREDDLKDLFRAFGPVACVYLAKNRETFQSRGFAFVSFMYREDAERAMNKLQGYGYDHLILKIEWAKPSNKPAGEGQDPGSMSTTFRSGYGKALPQNVAPK